MIPLVLSPRRHAALTTCLADGVPATASSQHFTIYRLAPAEHSGEPRPELVVVHSFSLAQIDNNLGYYVANELLPLLTVTAGRPAPARAPDPFAYDEQTVFEHCVGAIVRSIDGNERRAWHRFYANSLDALERAMARPAGHHDFIEPFGAIYRQAISLLRGRTLLDAGTCFGFLPLLLARRQAAEAALEQVVGCDLDSALMSFATAYATCEGHGAARFVQADLLAPEFARVGRFDTVTCIHVLEHFACEQTMLALENLWRVTRRRLIVAVPIEPTPDARFGHRQVFDRERLLALGRELGARHHYLEEQGGWLVVDKEE